MEIANATLWLTDLHSVPKKNITPAEYLILRNMHAVHSGKLTNVEIVTDLNRTSSEELERLLTKYHPNVVNGKDGAFPGGAPTLPKKFEDLPEPPETTPFAPVAETPPITKHASSQEWDEAATPPTED